MRPAAIIAAGCLAILVGCTTSEAPAPRQPVSVPSSGTLVHGQETKDTTVVSAANTIDKVVEKDAPQVAAPVREQTDKIREAVAANPAGDIKKLATQFEEAIKLLKGQLDADDKLIKSLQAMIERLQDAEQKRQVRDLRYIAFAAIALAGLLAWAKQFQFSAAFALGGLLAFGLAQLVSQPWFMPACAGAVGLILVGVGWAAVHAYRKHELAAKVEKEAAKLKDTLTRVVPAVDSVVEDFSEAGTALKAKLRKSMTKEAKATIHEIRASAKLNE